MAPQFSVPLVIAVNKAALSCTYVHGPSCIEIIDKILPCSSGLIPHRSRDLICSSVNSHVPIENCFLSETYSTLLAGERVFSSVYYHVGIKVSFSFEMFSTLFPH